MKMRRRRRWSKLEQCIGADLGVLWALFRPAAASVKKCAIGEEAGVMVKGVIVRLMTISLS